jgi:hypothetical protein
MHAVRAQPVLWDSISISTNAVNAVSGMLGTFPQLSADSVDRTTAGLSRFIYNAAEPELVPGLRRSGSVDDSIDSDDDNNRHRWYFDAPAPLFFNGGGGERALLYNGTLQFWLETFSGNFNASNMYAAPFTFVQLECAACGGLRLAQRHVDVAAAFATQNAAFDDAADDGDTIDGDAGAAKGGGGLFRFRLTELARDGWLLLDPAADDSVSSSTSPSFSAGASASAASVWRAPTQCEFVAVLRGLSGLRIYGDLTLTEEVVGLDDIVLQFATCDNDASTVPLACYDTRNERDELWS